ncbi:MAG: hypothetical protein ACLFP4_10545 [Spirochaetales bacterium]
MNKQKTILMVTMLLFATVIAFGQTVSELIDGEPSIWTGDTISFAKEDGADPTSEENQDRITESVWITRGNRGGQIYNAAQRNRAFKATSPAGTLWAEGTTDELDSLTFARFRDAVGSPKDIVGRELVLFIVEEEIFVDVTFTAWSQEKRGGFAYERSTPE